MNFSMGSIEEAKVAAQQADNVGGNYITEPGAYAGKITKAYFHKFPSGSGGLQIEADVEKDGEKKSIKVIIFTLTKAGVSTYEKDKKIYPLPGMNQIQGGLMPVANKKDMPAVKNAKGEITYPSLDGVDMGFLVNIRITDNKKKPGKTFKNIDLVAFYDPKTNKTGSEILNNTEAKKKIKIEAGLKTIDESTKQQPAGNDPFGDDETNDVSDNPFETKEPDVTEIADTVVNTESESAGTETSSEADPDAFWNDKD